MLVMSDSKDKLKHDEASVQIIQDVNIEIMVRLFILEHNLHGIE